MAWIIKYTQQETMIIATYPCYGQFGSGFIGHETPLFKQGPLLLEWFNFNPSMDK